MNKRNVNEIRGTMRSTILRAVYLSLRFLDDETYLKLLYRVKMKTPLHLSHPVTFNEKLQWLKLYDKNPDYIRMVDKYEAKKYVADIIGNEHIIPTLGVWDSFDAIDFNSLPDQFVLKCTHDSGGLVICRDKATLNIKKARKKINRSLSWNYFWKGREWQYKNVKPRIIAEQYMEDSRTHELPDYKFMCFNGKVRCVFTCTERFSTGGLKVTFFDLAWNKLSFTRHFPSSEKAIGIPKNMAEMIKMSEKLAGNIPFLRVDFYEIDGQYYFGELTLRPGSGIEEFNPEDWDVKLGEWLKLPDNCGGGGYIAISNKRLFICMIRYVSLSVCKASNSNTQLLLKTRCFSPSLSSVFGRQSGFVECENYE